MIQIRLIIVIIINQYMAKKRFAKVHTKAMIIHETVRFVLKGVKKYVR